MTPPRHPSLPAAEASGSRLVIDYGGMQIHDGRERVRILLAAPPSAALVARLRTDGFKRRSDGSWDRPATPDSIFTAQGIGRAFFRGDQS